MKARAAAPAVRFDPGLLVVALLALFAILPLLVFAGLPNTADGPAHLMRQAELNQAWQDGIFYPRWAPDLAHGYGMPLFNYAPPVLYFLTQVLHSAGLALDSAMKGTIILMILLYALAAYLFGRDLFGPRAGLVTAAVYLYAPYRLREIYVQGNYGQFCGLAFYPLILWSYYRLATEGKPRYLLLSAMSMAGLLLSHNISTMLFIPLLTAYLVFLLATRIFTARPHGSGLKPVLVTLFRFVLASVLGIGLAAFFWLPAFGERDLIRLSGITSGFFDFRHNFISLNELLALPQRLDLSAINPYYPLSLGTAQIALAGLACLALIGYAIRPSRQTPSGDENSHPRRPTAGGALSHVVFFGVALLVYAWLALPFSQPAWETVPMLELAEFPWRMLGPAILCAALLAGGLIYLLQVWLLGKGRDALLNGLTLAALLLPIGFNLPYLYPVQFITWGTPTPEDVMAYEAESGAIGTTSTGEFLPRWADRYPSPEVFGSTSTQQAGEDQVASRLDPASLPEGATSTTLIHNARETLMLVDSPAPFEAVFRALYWPGWEVWLTPVPPDGYPKSASWSPVEDVLVTVPEGQMSAGLPAGRYWVRLRLSPTPIRRAAAAVSILSLMACFGVALWVLSRREKSSGEEPIFRLGRREAVVLAVILVAGLLVTRPMAAWFRVQSPPGSVPGLQYATRATFGDRVTLLGFDLPACPVRYADARCPRAVSTVPRSPGVPELILPSGGTLQPVLYWQATNPLDANYSVFLHLDAPDGTTYAGADERHPADIPTSHWAPSMYLRNPLSFEAPSGIPAIRYTLTAGLYDSRTHARLPVTECYSCPALNGGENCSPDQACTLPESGLDTLPLAYVWVLRVPPLSEDDIVHRLDYRLGENVSLVGYDLEIDTQNPQETPIPALLTLYWHTAARDDTGYTVFIHLLDEAGIMLAQFDALPVNGLYPTDAWLPGQIIADSHSITLPGAVTSIELGLYDPSTQTRLPVSDGVGRHVPDGAVKVPLPHGR